MPALIHRLPAGLLLPLLLLLPAALNSHAVGSGNPQPVDSSAQGRPQAAIEARTENGWTVRAFSESPNTSPGRMHKWRIQVLNPQGRPAPDAVISVRGGMPEHDHGLPTQPQITDYLGDGYHRLEGVRFHMPGNWQLILSIDTGRTVETAVLEFFIPSL